MTRLVGTDRPRVLAFADGVQSLVAACRLHAPLAELRHQGFIADYVVTDHTLRGISGQGAFDIVWVQRAVDPMLVSILAERLAGRFLLDVDDHLLCRPRYIEPRAFPPAATVREALAACRVLSVSSSRLISLLAARSGLPLADMAVVCPNAIDFSSGRPRTPRPPGSIVLTQGHRLALTDSRDEVLGAVLECARRYRLRIRFYGSRPAPREDRTGFFAHAESCGAVPYAEYHRALAGPDAALGIAPLETRGDADTLEFVSGKSDIKMVEFGGYGHPGVYSRALPYVESDLACGLLAENTASGWRAALEEIIQGGWERSADEQARVMEKRSLRSVARESWWPALRAATLEEPIEASALVTTLDRVRARGSEIAARIRWHLKPH